VWKLLVIIAKPPLAGHAALRLVIKEEIIVQGVVIILGVGTPTGTLKSYVIQAMLG
jgi:hypothetical protein